MKKLNRMLLIHWYTFAQELMEFDTINFLTGNNSAGKSTLVDAMQVVLLGDTSGRFFNKAASEKSDRSMRGYLYGEWGDDGAAGFTYIRKGPFTTYLVMEFEDTERRNLFLAGFACDCYEDMNYRYRWFVTNKAGLPEDLFVDPSARVPYQLQDLKKVLTRFCGKNGFEVIETNRRYQEVLLAKFGSLKRKYLTMLRKAVPFTPIADIEKFITESICDVKNNIEIDQMQNDIREYKSLELEAQRAEEKIGALRQIEAVTEEYEGNKEKYAQQSYIVIRASQEEAAGRTKKCREELEERAETLARLEEEEQRLAKKLESLQTDLTAMETEYYKSDMVQKKQSLEEQILAVKQKIAALQAGMDKALDAAHFYAGSWQKVVNDACADENGMTAVDVKDPEGNAAEIWLHAVKNISAEAFLSFDLKMYSLKLLELKDAVTDHTGALKTRAGQLQELSQRLQRQIDDLKKGIKPYPEEVVRLKRRLEEGLFDKYHRGVDIPVFADLLEIKDAAWRNAIEGYLDRQKFYLLVPASYFADAAIIYDRIKKEEQIFDTGIVDIGRMQKDFTGGAQKGSLAEEIETDHRDARLYADFLLGNVMKCEDASQLNRYRTAITKNVMLYRGYVARRLNPKRYANPFIGRRSMEIMLENAQREKKETDMSLSSLTRSLRKFVSWSKLAVMSDYEAAEHEKAVRSFAMLPQEQQLLGELEKEYGQIDLTYISRLEIRIEDQKKQISLSQEESNRILKLQARTEEQIGVIENEKLPLAMEQESRIREQIAAAYDHEWIETVGQPRFLKELSQGTRSSMSLRESFERACTLTKNSMEKSLSRRRTLRAAYNRDYIMPYDIEREDNREYDNELHTLADIRLPDYIEKIRDSREKAYNQFRDDFIAKLKSNIETVREQILELNDSLRHSTFGTDKYRFVITPRAEYRNYYDMITDPMLLDTGGWNITSANFNAKYQNEIDSLFKNLILTETDVSAERRAEYERNIRRFTDYKTYLVFDLIVTNEQGEEQRLSRTLLKKSGGETQIPFYISLLASFSQVCRIRSKGKDNTLRLIILDEAFSKMDGERIRESIPLLRRFGLQAVFSAPPGKIGDIAPLVDRNIAVYRKGKNSFTRHFDPAEIEVEDE